MERTPAAVNVVVEEPSIDITDPMSFMMTQKSSKKASTPRRPVPVPEKSAIDEVREKLQGLTSCVIPAEQLADFNLAVFWTRRYHATVAQGGSGRFERAAATLAASAVGNPLIESAFSTAKFIQDDHRMCMKAPTLNACLIFSENRDLAMVVLKRLINEWLMAQEMNFRRLIFRPSLIADDSSWPDMPEDRQIASVLRFAFGMEQPLPRWAVRPIIGRHLEVPRGAPPASNGEEGYSKSNWPLVLAGIPPPRGIGLGGIAVGPSWYCCRTMPCSSPFFYYG